MNEATVTRRTILKKLGLGTIAAAAFPGLLAGAEKTAPRRNVLFIAVDDLRPQMGCYGDPHAVTPRMDRLAKHGMVFRRAYCQQAVCNPSRASLMTGRYPDTIKVWDLGTHFRKHMPNVVTLPQHFKNHGYHTECIGKIYHDPRRFRDKPSWSVPEQLAFTREVRGKYVLKDNLRIYQPGGRPGKEKAAATECADVPDNAYIDGRVADKAVQRLGVLRKQDKPFFLAVGFRRPHLPFSAPKKYWDMQKSQRIGKPANPTPPANVPKIALHDWRELRGYTDIPRSGKLTDAQTANLRHGYYAAMSYVDAQIGRVLAELDRLDLRSRTVICLWGDHGWHLGEHGLWGKTTNFELDTRVPLIFAIPGQKTAGQSTRSLAEFTDIYPTLVELCELPAAESLEGRSIIPVLKDPTATVRKAAFSQFPRGRIMGYSMRTDHYRYTEWRALKTGQVVARELYDHHTDAKEMVNIAADKEHQATADKLSKLLSAGWKAALPSAKS
ncbi:MAG: sulfatase [Phycisphaerae bacterium]|jgi:iduronate 2-sulfatase|nr:sulfatase [Phycisphaerae bacterium]